MGIRSLAWSLRTVWLPVLAAALLLAFAPRVARGELRLVFSKAELTKDSRTCFHLEMDATLMEETSGFPPHDPADPFDSDEWKNDGTGVRQTTLTHAFLHDPVWPGSPDPGDPDYWLFNVGLKVDDFDFNGNGSDGEWDGVGGLKPFILGSHVDGPHTGEDVPITLPMVVAGTGAFRNNDGRRMRVGVSGEQEHPNYSGKHFDYYSVTMEFVVDEDMPIFGILLEVMPDAKELVLNAEHVTSKKKKRKRVGRTFGTSQGGAFFASTAGSLSLSHGPIDIVSVTPADAASVDPGYASDPLVGGLFASMQAIYTGQETSVHRFVPDAFGGPITTVAVGDAFFQATWDEFFIDPSTGLAKGSIRMVEYRDAPDDNPSAFLSDAFDEHLMHTAPDRAGFMFQFDASALLTATNGFTQDAFVDGFPFTISGGIDPVPAPGPHPIWITMALVACGIAATRALGASAH
jgi:hypothetical protein